MTGNYESYKRRYEVLTRLRRLGSSTQTIISRGLFTHSQISRILTSWEKSGIINSDQRGKYRWVTLTDQGKAILKIFDQAHPYLPILFNMSSLK